LSNIRDAEKQVAQMFCVGFEGVGPTPEVSRFLREQNGGGYILFRRNIESPEQLRSLNEELRSYDTEQPVFAMVDQEGGRVMRLGDFGSPVPPMARVGGQNNPRWARKIGGILGREVRAVGFNVNCAPVLDVHSNPDNPIIGDRAFSSDPMQVAAFGAALIQGLHESGVLACGKHFPGHGDTSQDSHLELPVLEHDLERLNRVELAPFRAVFAERPPALLMSAHVLFKAVDKSRPATLSPLIIEGILRKDMGYDGVVVTDDLEMKALADRYSISETVEMGFEAGVDLFLICREQDRWMEACSTAQRLVRDGVVSPERVFRSIRRIARAKTFLRSLDVPTQKEMGEILRCDAHLELLDSM
jgi:beta-N-acetylhexosaminidase